MTKQKATELANKINLEGLNKEIKRIAKHPVNLQCEIRLTKEEYDIYINDPVNYAHKMGMMSCVFESVFIQSFGRGFYDNKNDIIRFYMNFMWVYKKGGKNGTDFLTATYNFNNNKWEFAREGAEL